MRSKLISAALPVLLAGLLSSASFAQSFPSDIQTETLGAARAFDAGALDANSAELGLDLGFGLWQGTSAASAADLIEGAPIKSDNALIRDMVRAALLSAGEPPQGEREIFDAARLRAVMAMGDEEALNALTSRNPVLAQSTTFRAERALAQSDGEAACDVSDQITTGRAEPVWSRLRIVCHVLRGEEAAAELTRDLLQNSGYEDANYFALLGMMLRGKTPTSLPPTRKDDDALIDFMRGQLSGEDENRIDASSITDSEQDPQSRLKALWANLDTVSTNDLSLLMSDIAFDTNDIVGSSSFDLESATADRSPQGTGQLFLLARGGTPEALAPFLARAPYEARDDLQEVMYDVLPPLTGADKAALDLSGFVQKAIDARDIESLRGMYQALEGDPRQTRLALATDSIGNGFNFGPLGSDIDERLQAPATKSRARRDAMIALAMGAQISDAAKEALSGYNFADGRSISDGDLIILQEAARASSQAELVLRSAELLDGSKLNAQSLSMLIRLLNGAGLTQFAGRIAAQDFVSTF